MTKIRLLNWFLYFHLVCSFHHIFLGVKSLQMFEPYLPVRVCTPEIACCYLHATSNILHLYLYLQISISISISISNIKDIRFLSPSWLTTIRQDPMDPISCVRTSQSSMSMYGAECASKTNWNNTKPFDSLPLSYTPVRVRIECSETVWNPIRNKLEPIV